jgi:hypothetical protein
VLTDFSGYGNNGTLTNMDPSTDWVASDGKVALDFDGSDDWVNVSPVPSVGATLAISYWVNQSTLSGNQGHVFFGTQSVGTATVFMQTRGTNYGAFRWGGGGLCWTTDFTTGWKHLAFTYDGTTALLFLNGYQVASAVATLVITNSQLSFGGYDSAADPLSGKLDDIRLYSRVLTTSEVAVLASRRGIAYETTRTRVGRRGSTFKAAWARNSNVLIGAGT